MRVLWLCNMPLPFISEYFKLPVLPFGGWLTGIYNGIKENSSLSLGICFPVSHLSDDILKDEVQGVSCFGFPRTNKSEEQYERRYEIYFREILDEYCPDIVHIFGTEYCHSLAMVKAIDNPEKTLISIQGLVSVYAEHYYADLPHFLIHKNTFRTLIERDNLFLAHRKLLLRGSMEKKALEGCHYIIGRTDWDKACTEIIAPQAKYYFCNETLRESFYNHTWNIQNCERHSIFTNQYHNPVKGFHYLLRALPSILERFPDTKIYTTGINPFSIPWYKINVYQKYIRQQITQLSLQKHIFFIGKLDEEDMCHQYLKCNTFVSCSSIENSPNSIGEALLMGVPTISSDVGGVKNLLHHNIDGYIYQHNAPYMLAYYICRIFEHESIANNFSKNARKSASVIYDNSNNAETLVTIYNSLI